MGRDRIVVEAADGEYRASGARTATESDPGPAVQGAIDAVARAGGGEVVVTGGDVFLGEPVAVRSGVRFGTAPGTTLFNYLDAPDEPVLRSRRTPAPTACSSTPKTAAASSSAPTASSRGRTATSSR